MRWAGRIIALPLATFFFVFSIGDFIDTLTSEGLRHAMNIGGLLGVVTIIIIVVGCVISWWWLLPAGAILIFAYLFGAISSGLVAVYHVGYFHWSQFRDFWSIPGILYLIAGMLFILSWRLDRKVIVSTSPPS
jgi:hypothetical protein